MQKRIFYSKGCKNVERLRRNAIKCTKQQQQAFETERKWKMMTGLPNKLEEGSSSNS